MKNCRKAGIIGTGWIAELHAKALAELNIPIAAVIGHNAEKARAFAEKWNIPIYGTKTESLYAADVDAVHICTPPASHYEQIKEAISHRKHVFCEKPLCLDPEQATELATLAERESLICTVGFNVRYYQACQKAREIVSSSNFGKVLLIHGSYLQEFGAEPAQWSWRYEDKMHAVTEIGSHWLDLCRYISGKKINAVSALFDSFHPLRYKDGNELYCEAAEGRGEVTVSSEDVALVNLRFEGGAIGSVVLSELSHGRGNRVFLEITGEKQSLWWNSEDNDRLFVAEKGKIPTEYRFDDSFEDTFVEILRRFYRGEIFRCPSFADAKDNVLLCQALWHSNQENSRWVEV